MGKPETLDLDEVERCVRDMRRELGEPTTALASVDDGDVRVPFRLVARLIAIVRAADRLAAEVETDIHVRPSSYNGHFAAELKSYDEARRG